MQDHAPAARIRVEPAPSVPDPADPRIPPRDRVVTRDLIERWALERPDKVFLAFDEGATARGEGRDAGGEGRDAGGDARGDWTYAVFRDLVVQTALGLQRLGVGQGDRVLVWAPNGREQIRIFFALNWLGAVYVPINTAFRGALLAHVIRVSQARLAVVHADLAPRLAEVDTGPLERLVLLGGAAETALPAVRYEDALLPGEGVLAAPARAIRPWDPMAIIYTSGTTGPSKAVLVSYLHLWSNAGPESWPFVGEEDRYLVAAPMFHIGGMGPIYVMLARGASVAMLDRFDTAGFWDSVRRTGATVAFLLGVMATFLEKRPPAPDDADNPLRVALIVPLGDGAERFAARFGLAVHTIFNMTEISSPIVSEPNPAAPGTCGRVRAGVEVRLVDGNDCEVPTGEVGEMIVRTDRPWAMNSGYFGDAAATAAAWRNGWFHTGDAFRRDAEGNFFFVDRIKDTIRRRGENISSFEVEVELLAHPDVNEAAAVAAPSELGEDDVMAVVSPVAGREIDPAALLEFLRGRMAYFMLPRYVRVLPELPKTPSAKVMKHELRAAGPAGAWDREAAGVAVKGERFAR